MQLSFKRGQVIRILIVGGLGFIGQHVTRAFRDSGYCVRVLTRHSRHEIQGVKLIVGNVADPKTTRPVLEWADLVVYLAGTSTPGTSDDNISVDIVNNLLPLTSLLQMMRERGCRRLIYFSSGGAIYGLGKDTPFHESARNAPLTSYGVIKCAAEMYLAIAAQRFGLSPVVLRPSNPYGFGQNRVGVHGLIGTLLWSASTGTPVNIWGNGEARRDYVHVSDVAQLCLAIATRDCTGTFNVGSGQGFSVNELVAMVKRISGRDFDVVHKPARPSDARIILLDTRAVRAQFDWQPRIGMEEGIAMTWSAIKESPQR